MQRGYFFIIIVCGYKTENMLRCYDRYLLKHFTIFSVYGYKHYSFVIDEITVREHSYTQTNYRPNLLIIPVGLSYHKSART